MPTLFVTRGLPASGKTTWARSWVAGDPAQRARVNKDDLRAMVDDGVFVKGVTESRILAIQAAAIQSLLAKGIDVIADNTHLPARSIRDMHALALKTGAHFEVIDFTDVDLETCIAADAGRDRPVGEDVIQDMHRRYLKGKSLPLDIPLAPSRQNSAWTPYEPPEDGVDAIIVDIDGTVALMRDRGPFDWPKVGNDIPNQPVIDVVRTLFDAGCEVIFVSGRSDACFPETCKWLDKHVGRIYSELHMRKDGDWRKDTIVKYEIFNEYIRHDFNVRGVFDDRNSVVEMWRDIGLTVFQVADGDF